MSYDLNVTAKPGAKLPDVAELLAAFTAEATFGEIEVHALEPDSELDVDTLADAFESEELDPRAFRKWCRAHALPDATEPPSPEAASAYLRADVGTDLLLVALQAPDARLINAVVKFAHDRGLAVHDPQLGEDLD